MTMYTVQQAAERFGVPASLFREAIKDGRLNTKRGKVAATAAAKVARANGHAGKMTLLEKAKAHGRERVGVGHQVTAEHAELVMALANSEVTGAQFTAAIGLPPRTNVPQYSWTVLVRCLRAGLLKLSK